MEVIEATTVFMEQFSFIHIFIFFQAIKIGPDISRNGHGVVLELRKKEHGKFAWVRAKIKLCLRLLHIGFTEIEQYS